MTRLGFLLDSDSCIGCHACTVACKSEHDVPLGVNRTWVKYIESGTFPAANRHFSVMRCNQCDDAPCMTICPTGALFRSDNGVVDFDDSRCIGCKGCMNACPYDALHINPVTNTAQKCNFCNHRIEQGLEPSCVVVCPTHAIVVADLDDPDDPATRLIAREPVAVRAPEKGTRPKVYYRGADPASLDPLQSAIAADGMIWADTTADHRSVAPDAPAVVARTTYTAPHAMTWRAKVSGYLVTKAIAAGVMLIATLLVVLGHADDRTAVGIVPPMVAGAFLALTGVLLVADLKQPTRFHYLLTMANRQSWLVKGAYVLMGFAGCLAIWWVGGVVASPGTIQLVAAPTAVLAAGTAGYTALLFGQCMGRDLWQTPLLLPTLLAQAVVAGGATYALLDVAIAVPDTTTVHWAFLAGIGGVTGLVVAEVTGPHSPPVDAAIASMTHGSQRSRFLVGTVGGLALPALLLAVSLATDGGVVLPAVAGICALGGLWAYEDAFVRAGQSAPLS